MIYVFTAVHDRYKITEKFVDQLLRQTYKDIKLVLVDDGCTDGTADMVRSKIPEAVIIQGDGNLWWGGALHEAYKWTVKNADRSAFAMFANDDSEFEDDYIEKRLKFLIPESILFSRATESAVRQARSLTVRLITILQQRQLSAAVPEKATVPRQEVCSSE